MSRKSVYEAVLSSNPLSHLSRGLRVYALERIEQKVSRQEFPGTAEAWGTIQKQGANEGLYTEY